MVIVQVLKIQHGSTALKEVLLIHRNQKYVLLLWQHTYIAIMWSFVHAAMDKMLPRTTHAHLKPHQHDDNMNSAQQVRADQKWGLSADHRLQGCHHPAHSPISQAMWCHVPHTKHTTESQKVFSAVPLQTATAPAAALLSPNHHSHVWHPRHSLGLLRGSSATTLTNI